MNLRRAAATGLTALLSVTGLVVLDLSTAPAHAAWTAPQFVRSISGNGRPGMFSWGAQFNPVTNEVIVGDYLNNQIRRYSPDGRILGSFYREDNKGQPYSIAVDSRNGDIYVPEIADGGVGNRVAHYTKTGSYVRELNLSGSGYHAWISIDGSGSLFQADSHYSHTTSNPPRVRIWRLSDGQRTRQFNVLPPGTTSSTVPRIYGIDTDPSGSIWLTDTFNNRILKYSATGGYQATYGAGMFHGDARGMEIDATRNRVYVSDPTVGQVQVFNLQGQFVESLGDGAGTGPLKLGGLRQPTTGPDGTLYVAEYGNARVHRFTASGDDAGYFPDPAQPAPAGQLGQPRDVDVDDLTGDVWVADSWNQRFQRFRSTGEFAGTWGTRSANPEYGMNYPRGIGVDPVSRRIWVVNQRGHHIKRYSYDGSWHSTLGDAEVDSVNTGYFRWPLDVEFHAGKAVVTDRNSTKVKILDADTGAELSSFNRSNTYGAAVDPATGNILVSDSTRIYVYNPTGTSLLTSFGSSGTGDGQFRHIWDMVVSGGVLYVTDDVASRIQAFTLTGTFLGKWGGFGSGAYQFKNPSGIATDAHGLLYVADAGNDRIMVFNPALARGGGAWPPPVVTRTYPGEGAVLPGRPARLSGTVTDETAVASVQIAVQDTNTGLWFDPANSTWSATQAWSLSPLTGDTSTSMSWSWTFIGVEYSGRYRAHIRAVDVAGNTSPVLTVGFSLVPEDIVDVTAPDTLLLSPEPGDSIALEPPLVVAGEAVDDTGVEAVDVRIRRAGTSQFLQPDGSFGTTAAWMPAALAEPDTISTAWTWTWSAPQAGSYEVATRARDVLTNSATVVLGTFTLTEVLPPDTTQPVFGPTQPGNNAVVQVSAADIAGVLTDDRAADRVDVAIKDRSTNLWLRADGSWGGFAWLPAALATPGGTSSTWSRTWPAVPGLFGYQLRAFDAAGNSTTQAFRPFTVN